LQGGIVIIINDQQVRLLVLLHLIRLAQRGAHEAVTGASGVTEAQLHQLEALSPAELLKLSEMPEPRLAIELDGESFAHGLRLVDHVGKRQRQLEYFIKHGATSAMLAQFFHLSAADIAMKRRVLGAASPAQRRPQMPSPGLREKIQRRWYELRRPRASEPVRADELEALHQEHSSLTFATLWAVVNEFAT
jgi:hypothetical protein